MPLHVHLGFHCGLVFSELCMFHGLTVSCNGPVEYQGPAMFVVVSRTCPLLGVYEFSSMQDSSCFRSVKLCKMCVKLGQRIFPRLPQGMWSSGTLCWKGCLPWSFICTLRSPMYSALALLGARKAGSSDTMSFFEKEIALNAQNNSVPCSINEGSPKTAIIYTLSFFDAVAGENNSMHAHCPEICCARANNCSMWQAEKAPRCLMDECSSPKQRGIFVRS